MKPVRPMLLITLATALLLTACDPPKSSDPPETTAAPHSVGTASPETNSPASVFRALAEALQTQGSPYTPPSRSASGYSLPYSEYSIHRFYEDKTGNSSIIISLNDRGEVSLISDHYKALVLLTVCADGSMQIYVASKGNYEREETVTPPAAISERPLFANKNLTYSNTESDYAPRYYLFYAMHLMDQVLGELGSEFSFEALGYTYADYESYQYHLYS